MNPIEIRNTYPWIFRVLRLDAIVGEQTRGTILLGTGLVAALLIPVGFLGRFGLLSNVVSVTLANRLLGLGSVTLGVWFLSILLEFYYRSNLQPEVVIARAGKEYAISVESARVLRGTVPALFSGSLGVSARDLLQAYDRTTFSSVLHMRLGIPSQSFENFVAGVRSEDVFDFGAFLGSMCDSSDARSTDEMCAGDILFFLATNHKPFADFLFTAEVTKEDLLSAALWVEHPFEEIAEQKQWWTKRELTKTSALGKDLGFGYTFNLDRYSHDLGAGEMRYARETRKKEIQIVEEALSRSSESNVLLVGDEGSGKHAILEGLAQKISAGLVGPALVARRLVVLDYTSITAATKSKGAFESSMIQVLNEAVSAGNIVLIIENFSGFLSSSLSLGTDALELMEPYLKSGRLQLIALSDPTSYHRDLEPLGKVIKLFEKVDAEEPTADRLLTMVEDAALIIESRSSRIFSFQAIKHSIALADRFIQDGAMPEKAISLLESVSASAVTSGSIIAPADIEAVVEKKTHIPTTKARAEERNTLLNMETLLHERMIDQEEAIGSVSNALRRARSGLKGANHPIGSFLFIGPTGVGKTETAKALAQVYFGNEDAMFRFDMSEYSQEDGVEKLIGSRDSKMPGVLASRLRERPFSLLLFDEFEKATRSVHNIFLQILDEGFFSDGAGKRVSARETMIIMTSNAGANLIIDMLGASKDSTAIKQAVIEEIRTKNIFTPELLNRFDEIVLFKPLPKEELVKVAMLMLKGLAKKLTEQEITFVPSDELAARVVEVGYDPIFGARPMRRAIADRVEQIIAKKILAGELKRGDTFEFTSEDIKIL